MGSRRRKLEATSLSVDVKVCRPKLCQLFHLKAKAASAKSSSSSSSMRFRGLGRSGGESVAVEKESDDPYMDFQHSMVQMIVENEIYGKEDLRGLLRCFLHLNSPSHHPVILRAFSDIWDSVFSPTSSSSSSSFSSSFHPSPSHSFHISFFPS